MTTSARISHRIGGIAESATLAVDAKAKALKAAGRPVIGFGAGEPDFPLQKETCCYLQHMSLLRRLKAAVRFLLPCMRNKTWNTSNDSQVISG